MFLGLWFVGCRIAVCFATAAAVVVTAAAVTVALAFASCAVLITTVVPARIVTEAPSSFFVAVLALGFPAIDFPALDFPAVVTVVRADAIVAVVVALPFALVMVVVFAGVSAVSEFDSFFSITALVIGLQTVIVALIAFVGSDSLIIAASPVIIVAAVATVNEFDSISPVAARVLDLLAVVVVVALLVSVGFASFVEVDVTVGSGSADLDAVLIIGLLADAGIVVGGGGLVLTLGFGIWGRCCFSFMPERM